MEFIQIEVRMRDERGSAAMRRLRRDGEVPANLYGLDRGNLALSLPAPALERFIHSGSHLVELTMSGESRDAILREVQHDPVTDQILHVDFQRVEKGMEIEDQVPVHYKGEAPGTKEGGLFQGLLDTVTVRARPRDLPEEILLDVSALHIGDAIYVRDVEPPEGVAFVNSPDDLICHVVAMRGRPEDELEGEGEEGAETPAGAEGEAEGAEASSDETSEG